MINIDITEEQAGKRIDKFLGEQDTILSRTYAQKLITSGEVLVNKKIVKANYTLTVGDEVSYTIPDAVELNIEAKAMPLDILYEDNDIILINKPKGMVVHPAAGHFDDTLVNALMYHCKDDLSGINGVMRPGIVHRIDKDTTGVLIACKNDKAHQSIAEQFKEHSGVRKYNALVYGTFRENKGRVEGPIGRHPTDRKKMSINEKNGKWAATNYEVLETLQNKYSHIECILETGRTHQIRVHLASINHPLLGDTVYGSKNQKFSMEGQALHARILGFKHPTTGEYMEFEAPLPEYFQKLLTSLRGN